MNEPAKWPAPVPEQPISGAERQPVATRPAAAVKHAAVGIPLDAHPRNLLFLAAANIMLHIDGGEVQLDIGSRLASKEYRSDTYLFADPNLEDKLREDMILLIDAIMLAIKEHPRDVGGIFC